MTHKLKISEVLVNSYDNKSRIQAALIDFATIDKEGRQKEITSLFALNLPSQEKTDFSGVLQELHTASEEVRQAYVSSRLHRSRVDAIEKLTKGLWGKQ